MLFIKNLANLITVTRLVGAAILLFTTPFSPLFWVFYIYCGASDLMDGFIARAMKQQSDLGAKLDSVADVAFFVAIIITVVPALVIPLWIWIGAVIIALIRVAAYWIGYRKFHAFTSLHTYANKATGGLLFGTPVLYALLGMTAAGVLLCFFAAFSACEELLITIQSKDLDRDRKSIFIR